MQPAPRHAAARSWPGNGCCDSGLGNISSIVGVPTISFFGAKRSSVTGPIGDNCIIIDKSHRCNPCKKNTCCLISISSDDVNSSIDSLSLDI